MMCRFEPLLSVFRTRVIVPPVFLFVLSAVIGGAYASIARTTAISEFPRPTVLESAQAELWVYGLLFGLTNLAVYFLLRVRMARWLSFCLSLVFVISPHHLFQLIPSLLRDYLKAPVILWTLVIWMNLAFISDPKFLRIRWLVLGGTAIAIGAVYRPDSLVLVPLFAVLILASWPAWSRRFFLLERIVLSGLFVWTTVTGYHRLNLKIMGELPFQHPVIRNAGFVTAFNAQLRVRQPIYELGHRFQDEYIAVMAAIHSKDPSAIDRGEEGHEQGRVLFNRLFVWFPADVLVRSTGMLLRSLNLPFENVSTPIALPSSWAPLFSVRGAVFAAMDGMGLFLFLPVLFFLCIEGFRFALLWLACVCVLGCSPVMQPFSRHYFHLEWMTLWNLGYLVHCAVSYRSFPIRQRAPKAGAFVLGLILLFGGTLFSVRRVQQRGLTGLFEKYLSSPSTPIEMKSSVLDGDWARLTSTGILGIEPTPISKVVLLKFSFETSGCGSRNVILTSRYDYNKRRGRPTFTRTLQVPLSAMGPTHLVIPVFSDRNHIPLGFEMPQSQLKCLAQVSRIEAGEPPPFRLTVVLSPSWRDAPLYQRLERVETSGDYTNDEGGRGGEPSVRLPAEVIPLSHTLKVHPGGLTVTGMAPLPVDAYDYPLKDRSRSKIADLLLRGDLHIARVDTDLFETEERALKPGDTWIVEGSLQHGGFLVGLSREGHGRDFVTIHRKGDFRVSFRISEEGAYRMVAAHDLMGYALQELRMHISFIGTSSTESR